MEKGRLKIFFGYAAGVGKTYAMLTAAREKQKEGVDVVIGYIEPHDRPDTLALTAGLEALPLREWKYRGIALREFDVDAALARRPRLILVDELAHTNAPGSKNRKRWLDVVELLNDGIDVYTTVNVQHIEGLHDEVGAATEVDVGERVPDEIFDYADEVALIDIEPADLIERLREGKIYPKTRAATALAHFFSAENLSSLRELFMRRSADRLEKQAHNGALTTKVLALISPSPSSAKNIRVAARMAEAYHCKFSAMYVETGGELSDEAAANIKKHMALVCDTGGELVVRYGEDVVETVADHVRVAGVTNLVIGKTWQSVGRKAGLEDKFIARLPEVEVLIVPDNCRFAARRTPVRGFFARLCGGNKLLRKYKTANRVLDISFQLEKAVFDSASAAAPQEIADTLARAFGRSCVIADGSRTVARFADEDTALLAAPHELSIADWCRRNELPAGKGTDTLRDAAAIYFPVRTRQEVVAVGFSCARSKMSVTDKLVFRQLEGLLKLIL